MKNSKPRKMKKLIIDVLPEQKVTLFDMWSQSVTTLQPFYRNGGLAFNLHVPSNVRVAKQ